MRDWFCSPFENRDLYKLHITNEEILAAHNKDREFPLLFSVDVNA